MEAYGASWLAHKSRLIYKYNKLKDMYIFEQATLWIVLDHDEQTQAQNVLLTRDYLDLFVEHLSSTTNLLRSHDIDSYLLLSMRRKIRALKHHALSLEGPFHADTIAIIPFSTRHAVGKRNENVIALQNMRLSFFEATFWSIYRYIRHIAVGVSSKDELIRLKKLDLPIFHIFEVIASENDPRWDLPKRLLLSTAEALMGNYSVPNISSGNPNYYQQYHQADEAHGSLSAKWKEFNYVYYTENDQILHMRMHRTLHEFMKSTEGQFMMVPHRMQTLLLPKSLPKKLQSSLTIDSWRREVLSDVHLTIENATSPVGSCCDNGRYYFKSSCGNFWYNCEDWGLKNMKNWIKFGKYGFSMPQTTEHLGRCEYSPVRKYCPIPPNCKYRIPRSISDGCWEIQNVSSI